LILLALLAVGLAELGWGIEVLPRHYVTLAGWGRAVRWSCAVIGFVLAVTGLLGQQAPPWFAGVLVVGALLLFAEMTPSGYANRP
jgi:hypothetical protein